MMLVFPVVAIIDNHGDIGKKGLADIGFGREVAFRFAKVIEGFADQTFDQQGAGFRFEKADDTEIKFELLCQQFKNAVEFGLKAFATGNHLRDIIQDA
jgi:hypothetical protein